MSNPLTASGIAEQWLYSVLSADTTIQSLVGTSVINGVTVKNVFSTVAPQGATYPMLVFANVGGIDVTALGPYRTFAKQRYAVKGIGQTSSIIGVLDPLMNRVDVLLFGQSGSFTNGLMVAATRLNQMVLGDPDMGASYRQLVSTYELIITESIQ